jgi:cyclopropane-fatty-acyl-phospholipid synthase
MSAELWQPSPASIRFHYDVGTDFYGLWLDSTLTYSAALWDRQLDDTDDVKTLHAAQLRKLDFAAELAGARGARRVLDIGCGWGSLLERLVNAHGVEHATGLTLSPAQASYARTRDPERITIELQGWREHRADEPYDALYCIEAFEHFGRPELTHQARMQAYGEFFSRCHALLAPSARMYLQTSAYGDAERTQGPRFLRDEVFPQSDLPRLSEICQAADRRFEVLEIRNDRADYERTLKAWGRALRRNSQRAVELTSSATVARYRKYLGLSAIAFHTGAHALYRIALRRVGGQ